MIYAKDNFSKTNKIQSILRHLFQMTFQVLEFEQLYLADLPDAHNYEKSFMHRDVVTFTAVAGNTDFAVTASCDGHVKFWYEIVAVKLAN